MKRLLICALIAAPALGGGGDVVKRGDIVPAGEAVAIEKVLHSPDAYARKSVLVEGVIENACSNKGCWMQITPAAGKPGMRVTFKNYAFFIPLDSKGMRARVHGTTRLKTLSKKEADHLENEGAKLTRKADGTAREVSFVASGVELRK